MANDALYSITREATHLGVHQDDDRRNSFRNSGPGFGYPPIAESKNINTLPDKIILQIFSFIHHKELSRAVAKVCKKWRNLSYDSHLWSRVSLRPEYGGLQVSNSDALIHIIGTRFGSRLRYIELPCELVTTPILHELVNKCQNLKYLTLDFANAMQLHDFNDLNAFPCNLINFTVCLSEVIFMEGFMRKVYQSLSSVQVLHLIGNFEQGDEEQEEIYEVINIGKIKAHTPNLKVVNFYGINFIDDSHVELLSTNCIHLESLSLCFCLRVKGSTLKQLIQRCSKLQTLLLQHCALEDEHMRNVEWEKSAVCEIDLSSTELSTECLHDVLLRINNFKYLALGYCEFFTDKILEDLSRRGKLTNLKALDVSHTIGLSENVISQVLRKHGQSLQGLMIAGKPKLTEQFFLNVIPFMKNIRILVCGTANGWFLRMSTRVHVDQIMICLSQNTPKLERLELQWDPDMIRFSDNSSKFVDQLRLKCPLIKSFTLSDGEYYEMILCIQTLQFHATDQYKYDVFTHIFQKSVCSLIKSTMESLNGKWSMQQIDESFVAVLLEAGYSEEAINRLKETTKGDNITFEYKIEGDSVEYILSQDGNEVHKVGGKLGESEQCNSLDGRQITVRDHFYLSY
ncbi:DgyrCDS393 [Dimorphilus gyrociliatus]|uniref:DgyrCDS393 n=1 Tax=Dimorphilus gyrociliatus TaxID=2664684 RepID=A0A7I8V5Y9_9ANNE|nr:DgyrCDS393 [Dimorphilus gyrociliatus]